ncbi:MAG: ABC transporter substrate-binding protein, partial [Spirochaetota bacterium]
MRKIGLLMVLFAVLLLPGLAFSAELKMRMAVNPETLDPTLVYTGDVNFNKMLFVNLCDFNEETSMPTPDFAKSWEVSKDGLTWTFKLRNDVKWTNGKPVTARDVEYSMKRI